MEKKSSEIHVLSYHQQYLDSGIESILILKQKMDIKSLNEKYKSLVQLRDYYISEMILSLYIYQCSNLFQCNLYMYLTFQSLNIQFYCWSLKETNKCINVALQSHLKQRLSPLFIALIYSAFFNILKYTQTQHVYENQLDIYN